MRFLEALFNLANGLVPPRRIDMTVRRSPMSPTELYLARQRSAANAWQEVDR